jgi:hypothetical protein
MKELLFGLVIVASLVSACGGGAEATNTPQPTKVSDAEGVIVTTDKTEYERGEVIKISVRNNLNVPLWYAQEVECGSSFWSLNDCDNVEVPYHVPCAWVVPQHDFTKLNPGETLEGSWDTKGEGMRFEPAEPGCYKIVFPYSLEEKKPMSDGWYGDRIEVYSNEFAVK